jgi:hypothetical protein
MGDKVSSSPPAPLSDVLPQLDWLDNLLGRLMDPTYLDGLDERALPEVRSMRTECDEVEVALSFLRRVTQGQLDLVHTLIDRRSNGDDVDLAEVIEGLPSLLAGPPRLAGTGRLPTLLAPDTESVDLSAAIEAILDLAPISELADADTTRLQALSERLSGIEAQLSAYRQAMHERLDRLQQSIVDRYKSGQATIEGLLS